MKIHAIVTVGRQVEGEFVCIRTEKAFKQASQAEEYFNKIKGDFQSPEGKLKVVRISSGGNNIDCYCEVGIFEIEVEE